MYKRLFTLLLGLAGALSAGAKDIRFALNEKGQLSYLHFPGKNLDTVFFNRGDFAGPSLRLNGESLPLHKTDDRLFFKGKAGGLDYSVRYIAGENTLHLIVSCTNTSGADMNRMTFSMHTGIDHSMKTYPQWRKIYFPTLLKCEKTHFWGYYMSPNGGILGIASPDPIASYRLQYNNADLFACGHLIHTSTLDFLNPGRLPEENPENCGGLKKGESRSWNIYLAGINELSEVEEFVCRHTHAPFINSPLYTVAKGETFKFTFHSPKKPSVKLVTPDRKSRTLAVRTLGNGKYSSEYTPRQGEGVYRLYASCGSHTSQGWFSVRYPWSDYIKAARRAALDYPQKASSHTESWLGFFSAYAAKRHFPDTVADSQVEESFRTLLPLMYDTVTFLPNRWQSRIQNHAMMASLFVQRYKAGKDIKDMYAAAALADFLLANQSADGAYRNGKVHYTSVIYIGKSIMEVMEMEKELAKTSGYWASTYNRHYASVKRAMDDLTRNLDNIQTEGENTFEDGMISCSYTQLAQFALLQPEASPERVRYLRATEHFANGHRCLSQLLIPDSRVRGASVRFWESQYDILTFPNFTDSPHGWSAWRIYGLKYLYRLTGDEKYLADMMNALGSCAQLLDPKTGVLNWAFVSDPYVEVKTYVEDTARTGKGFFTDKVIGRQYLPMISGWYKAPENTWVTGYWGFDGGCCDNDVHEIFKCMGEVALTCAYFHQRADGTALTWNCKAERDGDKWKIIPEETVVSTLYTNLPDAVETGLEIVRIPKK